MQCVDPCYVSSETDRSCGPDYCVPLLPFSKGMHDGMSSIMHALGYHDTLGYHPLADDHKR